MDTTATAICAALAGRPTGEQRPGAGRGESHGEIRGSRGRRAAVGGRPQRKGWMGILAGHEGRGWVAVARTPEGHFGAVWLLIYDRM
jgi:hypothetical protein